MDTKKKRQLEQDYANLQQLFDLVINSMPGNYWWKDTNGIYLGCNKHVVNIVGLEPEELIGKTDFETPWKEQAAEIVANDNEVMRTGKIQEKEETLVGADGKHHTFLVMKSPFRNPEGQIIGTVGTSFDFTRQKEIAEQFRLAKEKAEENDQIKTEFIRNMEHDIRTPFSGIYSLASVLIERETEQEKKEFLEAIAKCSKELLDYCNSIILLARTEKGSLPLLAKKFDLPQLIERVIATEMPPAIHKELQLNYVYPENVPGVLIGDPVRLYRVLINLVGNAIKFTSKGYVKISVKFGKQINDKEIIVQIFVKDTGMGIPEDKKDYIYEKFTRLTSSNQNFYKGAGIGLRVVKQLVDEMKGEIDLKSKLGEGSTFICTIPFQLPLMDEVLEE